MNTTNDQTVGFLDSKNIGGFGYGIGVSVGILLLITSITLASYFCTRSHHAPASSSHSRGAGPTAPEQHTSGGRDDHYVVELAVGLDEDTIKSYPKLRYSEATDGNLGGPHANSSSTCCSICLADYKAADALRQLPECGHLFHVKCVDPWLRLHPSCPVCRTSPIPTPLSTPLAEIVPLASAPSTYR